MEGRSPPIPFLFVQLPQLPPFRKPPPLHFNDGLWAFPPKGQQEDDGSAGPGCVERLPTETPPLTMKNTDNKLIAAAVTYAAMPTFKDTVNNIQQGFVPGRSFVGNDAQLDLHQESMLHDVSIIGMMLILSVCFPPTRLATLLALFCSILLRPSPRCSKLGSSSSSRPSRPL